MGRSLDQYGYVTLRDTATLNIDDAGVRMLVARRQLDRVAHGVYRFSRLPVTAYDPYMLAVLWMGTPTTCLSHDSALAAYWVCDINPRAHPPDRAPGPAHPKKRRRAATESCADSGSACDPVT